MPPKKRQKPTVTIQSDYVDSLPDQVTLQHTTPDRISQLQLARAYGLAPPGKNADIQTVDLLRSCPPKWTPSARVEESQSKPKPPEETQVISLVDDDDDEDDISMQKTKVTNAKVVVKKGKGKAKAAEVEFKPRVCSSENCSSAPKCLNWLGQDKWENSAQAWKQYRKSLGLLQDPENDRGENVPVGLKNLGATCYVNSFLQVWFRDVRFRAGVYSCEPPSNGNVESSPLFQLQVLFSFLQSSKQAVYDPTPLANSLSLDQTEQQDAQEFSKLFLSLLDHEFKKQSLKKEQEGSAINVGKLVQEQFEGSMIYGTRCRQCRQSSERPASFLELEVGLTRDCKLEDRIKTSFQDEQLTGDNQYFCETCDAKRDATRYSELRSLPPVLHFSLLRFTFNLKDFTRAKSQHAISYPLALDMGQFLPENPETGKKDQVWYDLKGVLMHKGLSAHHGHYVAQVYDEEQSKWFLFDDEAVSEVEDLNAPDVYDDEDGEPVVGAKRKKKVAVAAKNKGFTRDAHGHVLPKSKDAYMLVYTRRPDSTAPKPVQPDPPPLARAEVENLDEAYQKGIEEWNQTNGNAKEAFERLRESKRSVYQTWDVMSEKEEAYLMDKTALKRWLESGLKATPATNANGRASVKSEDQGLLGARPDAVESSGHAADKVEHENGKAPNTDSPSEHRAISADQNKPDLSAENGSINHSPLRVAKADSLTPLAATPAEAEKAPATATVDLITSIDNSGIVCSHGRANPAKAEQMKRVSKTAGDKMKDLGVTLEPELMVVRDFCRDCVAGMALECYYQAEHLELTEEFNDRVLQDGEDYCFVSRPWLSDWCKERPKMHSTATGVDPSPASEPYINDVRCEHGGLAADHKKRSIISARAGQVLQRVFPDYVPEEMNPDPCQVCAGTLELNEFQVKELRAIAQKEKKLIESSWSGQTLLTSNRLPLSADFEGHYVVPREWTKKWTRWIKSATRKDGPPRPGSVSNDSLLCRHKLLCIDLQKEVETAKSIAVATKADWQYLVKTYNAGPEVRVWIDQGKTEASSFPQVCSECLDEKRKNFKTTNLWVRVLQDSDLDEKGQRRAVPTLEMSAAVKKPIAATQTSSGQPVAKFYGVRASARTAAKRLGLSDRKALKSIDMDKGDKVKDLKPKIEAETGIPIIAQRIFYNLQELDGSQSVQELGLIGDATIEVYGVRFDDDLDLNDLKDVDVDQIDRMSNGKRGGKKRAREEGFGGTGLTGWDRQDADDSDSASRSSGTGANGAVEMPAEDEADTSGSSRAGKRSRSDSEAISAAMQVDDEDAGDVRINCPACTFLNDPGLVECEVCGSSMAG